MRIIRMQMYFSGLARLMGKSKVRVPGTRNKDGSSRKHETVYDEHGNWTVSQHHDQMRLLRNDRFVAYYRDVQHLTRTAEEFEELLTQLRRPLPTTIWINDTDPLAGEVSRFFEQLDPSVASPIEWYPIPKMAWRINADKARFRKAQEMQPLRQFLIQQTALGTTSRQEEVSMIPPLLLDIQPTANAPAVVEILMGQDSEAGGNNDEPVCFSSKDLKSCF